MQDWKGGGAIDLFLKLHSLQTNTVDSYICKHLLEEPQADNSLSANGVVHEENVKALLERKWDGKDTAEKACTNYLHRMLNYQKRKAGSGTDRCVMLDVFEEAKLAIGKCRFETAVKKENPEIGDHVQNAKCNELLQKAAQIEGITIPTIGRT